MQLKGKIANVLNIGNQDRNGRSKFFVNSHPDFSDYPGHDLPHFLDHNRRRDPRPLSVQR